MKAFVQKLRGLFTKENQVDVIHHRIVMTDPYHIGIYSEDRELIIRV